MQIVRLCSHFAATFNIALKLLMPFLDSEPHQIEKFVCVRGSQRQWRGLSKVKTRKTASLAMYIGLQVVVYEA